CLVMSRSCCGDVAGWVGVAACVATAGCALGRGAGVVLAVLAARAGPATPVTLATATALTPTAAWAATPAAVSDGAEPSSGVPTSQEVGPIAQRSRGADNASSARTTSGSNCVPLQFTTSASAVPRVIAFL